MINLKEYTKDQFFEKMEYEGSFEDMYHYCGLVRITDDVDMNGAWYSYCNAMPDLLYLFDEWESKQPLEEK